MNPLTMARAKLHEAEAASSTTTATTTTTGGLSTPAPRSTLPSFATPATPAGVDADKRIQRLKQVFKVGLLSRAFVRSMCV
jgi:hypothetical protein